MKLRQVSWRRYRLPFVTPFQTAHGITTHREGLILSLTGDDGLVGLGEAAPLVEFGGGDVDRTEALLRQLIPNLIGHEVEEIDRQLDSSLPDHPDTSAIRCGLETALLDLEAKRHGVRIANLLALNVSEAVSVNATIGHADTGRAVDAARRAVAQGLGTIKLKVGVAGSVTLEVDRVGAVREAIGPDVVLRLDANGAWAPEQAIRILSELAHYDIEFVEQPVAADDLPGLGEVRRAITILVAADEAVTSLESARRVIELEAADVLVIKPMVCGGLRKANQIIKLANDAGLEVVVTSSIESGIGVAAALHLAATLPRRSPACGLATLGLLANDLITEGLDVVEGRMRLPTGPGLGVTLDEERLNAFAHDEWHHAR